MYTQWCSLEFCFWGQIRGNSLPVEIKQTITHTQDAISRSHREERDRADCADRERAPKYKKRKSHLKECVLCEYFGIRVKGCCTHSQTHSHTHSHSHTLYDPMDYRPPGSSVHGLLQERILEWVAIPFFRGSSWPRGQTQVSDIADGLFTVWATREALPFSYLHINILEEAYESTFMT